MASTLNTLASATYIVTNGSTTVNFTPVVRADIVTGGLEITYSTSATIPASAAAKGRVPSNHVTNPGIFTLGTAPEGTLSNPTNDSNG
jgi:hypothetical protein